MTCEENRSLHSVVCVKVSDVIGGDPWVFLRREGFPVCQRKEISGVFIKVISGFA